jgi:glycosyltransferase involved in cell wall biosynthesis
MKELVSIVMPAFNIGRYLREAIGSVIDQTHAEWELLVAMDRGTDDTEEICGKFSREDERVRPLLLQENRGFGAARNAALEHARGSHVLFLDADDTLPPRALETLLGRCLASRSDIVTGGMEWRDCYAICFPVSNLGIPGAHRAENLRSEPRFPVRFPVATAKLYTARLIQEEGLRFLGLRYSGDNCFALASWHAARRVTAVPDTVYYRRRRLDPGDPPLSGRRGTAVTQDRIDSLLLIEDICAAHGLTETARAFREETVFNLFRTALAIPSIDERSAALGLVRSLLETLGARGLDAAHCLPLPREELDRLDPALHDDLWFEYRVISTRLRSLQQGVS